MSVGRVRNRNLEFYFEKFWCLYIYICSYLRIYYSNGNLHFTLRSFDFHKIHMFLSQDLLMVISEPEVVGLFGGGEVPVPDCYAKMMSLLRVDEALASRPICLYKGKPIPCYCLEHTVWTCSSLQWFLQNHHWPHVFQNRTPFRISIQLSWFRGCYRKEVPIHLGSINPSKEWDNTYLPTELVKDFNHQHSVAPRKVNEIIMTHPTEIVRERYAAYSIFYLYPKAMP